jgi:hypothetical protein
MNLSQFDPNNYGKNFSNLIDLDRLNELGPGLENTGDMGKIQSIDLDEAFGQNQIKDHNFANACLSALWLLHDFLDQSHQISQSITTSTGSFWHGIMHRREGDYWNSKYWFRQVGNHPVFSTLNSAVTQLLDSVDSRLSGNDKSPDVDEVKMLVQAAPWDPFLFVDMVEKNIGSGSKMERVLEQVQQLEWQLLFDYCYKGATGSVMP